MLHWSGSYEGTSAWLSPEDVLLVPRGWVGLGWTRPLPFLARIAFLVIRALGFLFVWIPAKSFLLLSSLVSFFSLVCLSPLSVSLGVLTFVRPYEASDELARNELLKKWMELEKKDQGSHRAWVESDVFLSTALWTWLWSATSIVSLGCF